MGVIALALMATIFPSALHLPILGPGGAPEIAPVPGSNKQQGSVSEGNVADSGTVGSGGAGVTGGGAIPSPSPEGGVPSYSIAQQAHCVGSPPRQTEDPLSPPCIAYWKGDNGGATWHGVTSAAVNIVISDLQYGHDNFDYSGPRQPNDNPYDTTARLLVQYFNSRFQTYGRVVHVYNQRSVGTEPDAQQRWHAFGGFGLWTQWHAVDYVKDKTMYFGGALRSSDSPAGTRADNLNQSPYTWNFAPTFDESATAFGRYVCAGLVGKLAVNSGDPAIQARTRKFAMLSAGNGSTANLMAAALDRSCGLKPEIIAYSGSASQAPSIVAKLKTDQITTILLAQEDVMSEAFKEAYIPEWVSVGGDLAAGYYIRQKNDAPEYNASFGITDRWRWQLQTETYWYNAALASDPTASPDTYMGSTLYYGLLMAFTAIQVAGPHLTPDNARIGLEKFKAAYQPPYSPEASYGPGDHNFVDDWMIVRWDSKGSPPGGAAGSGCVRLPDGGQRYLTNGQWPTTDRASTIDVNTPCQPDEVAAQGGGSDSTQT